MRKIIAGIIIGSTLTLSSTVFADSIKEYVLKKVEYPIMLNGSEYKSEELPVLNYDGNTYVPLKSVGDVLGTKVIWNEQLKRVEIGDKQSTTNVSSDLSETTEKLAIKINGQLYQIDYGFPIYIDESSNYYSSYIEDLLELYYKEYEILNVDNTGNPYFKGLIRTVRGSKYLKADIKYINATDKYFEGRISNEDKSKEIYFTTKPGEEKGGVPLNGSLVFPVKDVFDLFGIKYRIEKNETNKLLILSFDN